MTAKVVRNWLTQVGAKTLFIEPGSPWENGYCELFNGKLRDGSSLGHVLTSPALLISVVDEVRPS